MVFYISGWIWTHYCYVVKDGFKPAIYLPSPPKHWNYRQMAPVVYVLLEIETELLPQPKHNL